MKPQFKIKENKEGKFEVYYVEQKGKIFKKEVFKFKKYQNQNFFNQYERLHLQKHFYELELLSLAVFNNFFDTTIF